MGLFDKKTSIDPADLTVFDLEEGFLFELDGKSWEVFREYFYDWGDEDYTKEVGVTDGDEKCFLYMEDDDEVELVFSKKIPIRSIQEDLPDIISKDDKPPTKIEYKGKTYLLDEESSGYCKEGPFEGEDEDWEKFVSWDFIDESGDFVLSVERWGDYEFEASEGKYLKESDIQDIMPSPDFNEKVKNRESEFGGAVSGIGKKVLKGCGCISLGFLGFFLLVGLIGWFSSDDPNYKSPIDQMVKEMHDKPNFSIILHDMESEGIFSKTYKHQYKLIIEKKPAKAVDENAPVNTSDAEEKADNIESKLTKWKDVSSREYKKNERNMGMEIVHKKDGKVKKQVSPPGYSHYVGNRSYGYWNGGVWSYYGRYRFMSDMFYMSAYPVNRSYYNNYYGSYYGTGRAYYGRTDSYGRSTYGTYSKYNSGRSTRYTKSSSYRGRYRSGSRASRSSRSGSRYSGGSSHRSRGGGFGK
ncbi:MAG TPA: DUF4178 domain-containing protein [Bacteroidetes bacterium]|nr:DUF4178 domain-containing protein [Bacteroidota bacterium]